MPSDTRQRKRLAGWLPTSIEMLKNRVDVTLEAGFAQGINARLVLQNGRVRHRGPLLHVVGRQRICSPHLGILSWRWPSLQHLSGRLELFR